MNLIELRNDIIDSENLSPTLRKAKVLASILNNEEMKAWIDNELNGYSSKDDLPDYRKGFTQNLGDFYGSFGNNMKSCPIPIQNIHKKFDVITDQYNLTQGVRNLESLLESDEHNFREHWSPEIIHIFANHIFQNYTLLTAWKTIDRGQVEQVLDTIRNRLLSFIISLDEKYPEFSKSEDTLSKIPKDIADTMFNIHIIGNNNVVASGSDNVQEVNQQIVKNDLDGLIEYMNNINVPSEDVESLKEAIKLDGDRTKANSFGTNVVDWISNTTKEVLSDAGGAAKSALMTLIVSSILNYYGFE